jgi:acyl carrier protein
MTDQSDALSLIRRMAGVLLGVKPATLKEISLADAGADPLDVSMLIMEVEAEYEITISDMEVSSLNSCEDIARLVAQKLGVPNE